MEGKVTPPENDHSNDDPPLWLSPSLPFSPSRETYIIQIQKDQVYRVPPPENTLFLQRIRNQAQENKNNICRCSKRLCYIGLAVLAFILILCITLGVLHSVLQPKPPSFSATNVVVKNVTQSSGRKSNSRLQFEVTLMVKNPNGRMGINYEKDGKASFAFKKKNVANGEFPTLYQEQDASTKVKVSLVGSNQALPGEMDKSMNDKKSNIPISLDLKMKIPVSTRFGVISWDMEKEVECKIKLSKLKAGTKVSSQACETN
ncbi:Late embryogenesis abundant (LEA) hydroxyproline-rich glycoprotein family [Quillaja saponaria]|uniref:Late embryogenesis abundant (LEA) hydroxyproline-rich glycoprotein family n=1 Tax=Quillaja saponaria TaxID=32244 RepID=A0AAD7LF66_QUISA|nr:Late embryogenesis abundant (LEA) hydroxyproline-rich glycoprotein family [Quillaja saponaria]